MQSRPSTTTVWLIATVAWLAHGFSYADALVALPPLPERPIGWRDALSAAYVESAACWIFLTVGLVETVRRVPLAGRARWRGLALVAGAIVAVVVLRAAYVHAMYPVLVGLDVGFDGGPPFADLVARSFRLHTLRVALIAAVATAWFHLRGTQENALHVVDLQARLDRANADALAASIDASFLFGALDAIAARIRTAPDDADRLLVALSALLRASLDGPSREIALDDEAALARDYAAIESLRCGAAVELDLVVARDCADARVPALLVAALAAPALARRGVARIAAMRDGATLALDADGDAADAALAPVAARLRRLYGDAGTLAANGDGRVRVALPLRRMHA